MENIMRKTINLQKKYLALLLALCFVVSMLSPLPALAGAAPVGYMPGVTEEMADPAFWSGLAGDPDALLATAEDIARINAAAVAGEGTNRRDMKNLKETYDGVAKNEALQKSAQDDVDYYLGWVWDQTGKKMTQEDFDPIIANCVDPNAAEEMPVRWGIAVNRTELITFPWDGQILDDPVDFDFDYQPLVGIRVNEPVAIYATSADGNFFQVSTSCCTGWVRAEDIAICRDREEWLSAWDIPAEKRLVFWGDRMYTDYSKTAAETACRLITMGTVLERMDGSDPDALAINRLPLHNYAVYLPIRNEDGSYGKTPALINARERVSENYLPLTARNLATVALASLGDAYGWGAGLNNEDCTSLNHSVFCCFGLDLPRNGTWQWLLDFPKAEIANYTLEEKEALLDALPMGTLLNFPGHQMMYLGKCAGSYYVVSAVSSIMSPWSGKRQRTRDVQINTLDIRRANGKTWMQALNKVYVPWLYLDEGEEAALSELPAYHDATAFCLDKSLMDAYPTGYFLPERAATVAEGVQMLWRIAGKPEPDMTGEGFADVASGSEHEKAALWAKQTGVYAGRDGNFRAGANLTWDTVRTMAECLLGEDVIGGPADAGAAMTRAELAGIARPVSEAWEAQHPAAPEDSSDAAGANAPLSGSLSLAGVGNARELGGYTTEDGRVVKHGVLLRTAKLTGATEEDVERLLSVYHLATDVDFRGDGEVEKAPDPEMEGVEYLNIHILDESAGPSEEMKAEIAALEEQGVEIDKITQLRLFRKYGGFSDQMYVDFLSSDVGKDGYARFFQALLALPENRALLFHCSQGKDRTGCGAMLILFALGVDEETVMADFLLTNEYNADLIAEERAYLTENGIGEDELDEYMKSMDQVYPKFMQNAIQWMTETCGSPLGYITRELGVTEADIQALRDKFLE